MNDILQVTYLGKHRDEYVWVRSHLRHMSDGSVVSISTYPRRKWGTRK